MKTVVKCGAVLAAVLAVVSSSLHAEASDVPQNLGFGLDKLVESRHLIQRDATRAVYDGYATEEAAAYAGMAILDADSDRVLVDIVPTGKIDMAALRAGLESSFASLTVKAEDATYRNGMGVLEAYVSVDDVEALSKAAGVKAVFLALKPYTRSLPAVPSPSVVAGDHLNKIGTAFDQGVIQHRVDRVSQTYNPTAPVNYDGTGISVGILSDSYDTRSASPHASTGVANFDLPGAATNPWNTQPVVVLQDYAGGTDEGRGMVEIVYKMAPKARIAFATADNGEVGFANNIRALAALPGYAYDPSIQQDFKADVIADDVGYYDEPWYQDGIISAGIDDVAAAGVSYFSSAANDIGINGYESELRIVPNGSGFTAATNSALVGTNIDLSTVPASLYAGGFHNFNPNAGQRDVAQLVNLGSTQVVTLQWDDPYDTRDLELDQPPIFSAGGTISSAQTSVTFDGTTTPPLPAFVGGQAYVITETATSGNFDGIINIYDSAGNLVLNQDTGTDETVNFYAPTSDQYRIVVNRYSTTTGDFTLTVNTAEGTAGVTSDFNLLVFNTAGVYQSTRSLTSNNLATNRPIELGQFNAPSGGQVQFVIARANTPTRPQSQLPTHVRWLIPGNGASNLGPAEYFKYNTVTTGGHATAAGCNGTAAYSVFKPNVPEYYTSPGPATFYFDQNSNRLPVAEVRQQPRVAAADAGNTSFFGSDSTSDLDTNQNFSGTSAAAPHAAAIAALVLQSRGGSGSVSPEEMTQILQDSAFPHDLDPNYSSGTAFSSDGANVTVTISSDNETNNLTGSNDTSAFQIFYSGPGSLASITFNPTGAAATGGNVTGGNNGPMNDTGSSPATITYFENNYPGMAFLPATRAFVLGPLTGLVAADVTAPTGSPSYSGYSNPTPAPGNGTSQFNTMTIGFPNANFASGAVVRFTVGRGVQHSAVTGNGTTIGAGSITTQYSADMFGGGVLIPSGVVVNDGMAFSGTTTAGGTFSGVIRNNIGRGYSVLDGYGFIDASVATGTLRGVADASPDSGYRGDAVLFTVDVTPGSVPDSTQLAVTANLVGIGGAAAQAFYDDGTHGDQVAGDNLFSFATTVGLAAPIGPQALPIVVSDHEGRTGNAQIAYTVLASSSPTAVGSATPDVVSPAESTTLEVDVTPGAGPTSSGVTVSADLASIGGGIVALHDDGANGDAIAGDDVYSYVAVVAAGTAAGAKTLPVAIADAQGRTASTAIALSVSTTTSPSGVGAATPSTLAATETTLLTVQTTPGTSPASTGISVLADLTSIGGGSAVAFHDDGLDGDAVAGDGVYSYLATIPLGTAAGDKSLPVSIGDDQGRSGSAEIDLSVLAPTSPGGVGTATPSTVSGTETTLLTVQTTPGTNPASTGISVIADLTGIGGGSAVALHDDGLGGDAVAGDGVYSYLATVPFGTSAGNKSLPVTIADAQSRTATTSIAMTVLAPTSISVTAAVTPNSALPGGTALFTASVTGGTNPASSGIAVSANLTGIGGSAAQTLYDDGTHGDVTANDGTYSFLATVAAGATPGAKLIAVSANDAQGRTATASVAFGVQEAGALSAAGVPAAAGIGPAAEVALNVAVVPASNPASTGIAVTVDLSSVGGSAAQMFYDDGTHGDAVASDNVFTFVLSLAGAAPGTYVLPATVTDAQGRTTTTTIQLTLSDVIFRDGFDG